MKLKSNSIVFKTNSFPEKTETFIVANIVETIKHGFRISIIVDKIKSKKNSSQPLLIDQYKLLDRVVSFSPPEGKISRYLKAIQLVLNPIIFYFFVKYWLLKKQKSLDYIFILHFYKNFRNTKVFHVHFANTLSPLIELKKIGFLDSLLIVTFHGYDAHFLPKGNNLENLLDDYKNYVDQISVNSSYLKNILVSKGFSIGHIKTIPIGYDSAVFKIEKPKIFNNNPFKIITVGRLEKIKGHEYGIRAIKLLLERGYKIDFSIIGEGSEFKKLKALIKELNLNDTISLMGSKSQLEIKELLKSHQLFLMTSTADENNRREAFGVVSLEAQAMGLPVIGFDSGGFPETIIENKTGILVKDKDYNDLSKSIETLINNAELYKSMSDYAIEHVQKNFNANCTSKKYVDFYNNE
jgi:colanic acid/amylovoran biosynthesis glycosyltransferase